MNTSESFSLSDESDLPDWEKELNQLLKELDFDVDIEVPKAKTPRPSFPKCGKCNAPMHFTETLNAGEEDEEHCFWCPRCGWDTPHSADSSTQFSIDIEDLLADLISE